MNESKIKRMKKMSRKYFLEKHEVYGDNKCSHIVFNGNPLDPEQCSQILKFCSIPATSYFFATQEKTIFIKIKDIDNIQESLDILYERAATSEFNIKLIPNPNKHDIISLIKYRDQNSEKPLLYKKEDYMCTVNCKRPLDENISYDYLDNAGCSNEYEQPLGKTYDMC